MSSTSERIKEQLLKACWDAVNEKQRTIEAIINSHKYSLNSETKSSAGDKHETGRAMLQLEMEKASQQLAAVHSMKTTLERLNLQKHSDRAALGSLVLTDKLNYFLAISIGKVVVDSTDYFVVSTSSPLGKQLLGIEKGETIPLNNQVVQQII